MNPDHPYYADWAMDFSDDWQPRTPPIDLAAIVIFLWIIIGSLI